MTLQEKLDALKAEMNRALRHTTLRRTAANSFFVINTLVRDSGQTVIFCKD
jgi:hypothetical protein